MRHCLAVVVLTLASLVLSAPAAQSQDAIVASATSLAQQGDHDSAIAMLRGALADRPSDAPVRDALVEMLASKRIRLQQEMEELRGEIMTLRGTPVTRAAEGCDSRAALEVGQTIKAPMKMHDVKPVYPAAALGAGIGGTVVMQVTVGCSGDVLDAIVVRGVPELNEAALGAVNRWRYRPTLMNGTPIPVRLHVTITFTPNG